MLIPSSPFYSFLSLWILGKVGLPESTISTKKGCGGVESGSGGTIQSPNYPAAFPEQIDCMWVIRVRQDQHIYIKLMALQLFGSIGNLYFHEKISWIYTHHHHILFLLISLFLFHPSRLEISSPFSLESLVSCQSDKSFDLFETPWCLPVTPSSSFYFCSHFSWEKKGERGPSFGPTSSSEMWHGTVE